MIGHIKIDRKITKWEWYQDSNMVHVFLHLLLKANHKDGKYQGNIVKRGQLLTGRLQLAVALGLSEMQIRTCLKKLKSTNEITINSTSKFSIITICKYDSYQYSKNEDNQQINQQPNQQSTSNQPSDNQVITTNKNDNNDKNDIVVENHEKPIDKNELPTLEGIIAIAKKVIGEQIWTEQACMSLNIKNINDLRDWMRAFNLYISNTEDIVGINDRKYKVLFMGWVRMKNSKGVTLSDFKTNPYTNKSKQAIAPPLTRIS